MRTSKSGPPPHHPTHLNERHHNPARRTQGHAPDLNAPLNITTVTHWYRCTTDQPDCNRAVKQQAPCGNPHLRPAQHSFRYTNQACTAPNKARSCTPHPPQQGLLPHSKPHETCTHHKAALIKEPDAVCPLPTQQPQQPIPCWLTPKLEPKTTCNRYCAFATQCCLETA